MDKKVIDLLQKVAEIEENDPLIDGKDGNDNDDSQSVSIVGKSESSDSDDMSSTFLDEDSGDG